MDKKIFMALYGLGQSHKTLGRLAAVIAKYSYPFFYIVYIWGFVLGIYINKKILVTYLAVPAAVYLFNNTLRSRLGRKRPFQELNIKPLLEHKASPSCPSNHTACAMVISLAFGMVAFEVGTVWLEAFAVFAIVCGIFTGLSRVVCGIHYPKDILIGYINGICGWILGYNVINCLLRVCGY